MNLKQKVTALIISFFALSCFTAPSFALDDDTKQPIHIDADSATRDGLQEITTYKGNVIIKQGSLKVFANSVKIYTKKNKLQRIVASGNPVKMEQKPRSRDDNVHASAKKITYFPKQKTITLEGQATLAQAGRKLNSQRITYNLVQKFIEAKSTPQNKQRVHVVIPPSE